MGSRKYNHHLDKWIELYTEENWSTRDISEEYSVSATTVQKYLKDEGIDLTAKNRRDKNLKYSNLQDKWIQLYEEEKESTYDISKKYDVSSTTVRKYLIEAGVSMRTAGQSNKEYQPLTKEWKRLYKEEGWTTEDIEGEFNVPHTTISKYLREAEVQMAQDASKETNRKSKATIITRIENSGQCWEWKRRISNGYGYITIDGRDRRAHRVAYEIWKGPIPKDHHVRHKCDRKSCCKPSHLTTGNPSENNTDIGQLKRDLLSINKKDIKEIVESEEMWEKIAEKKDIRIATVRCLRETTQGT